VQTHIITVSVWRHSTFYCHHHRLNTSATLLSWPICVNEEHSRSRYLSSTRPHSSSVPGSGVAITCAGLTVEVAVAAVYYMRECAARITPADGFPPYHCPKSSGFTTVSNMVFYNCGLSFSHRKQLFPCTTCITIRSYSLWCD